MAGEVKILRHNVVSYIDTSSTATPSYKLLGLGVTTGNIEMNANTTTEKYIHEASAYNSIDSYAPSMAITQTAYKGDEVYDYVFDMYINRKTGRDCETTMLNIYLKEQESSNVYKAEKQAVAIEISSYGGDAGAPVSIDYTIHFNGDNEVGTATISDNVPTFVPDASV